MMSGAPAASALSGNRQLLLLSEPSRDAQAADVAQDANFGVRTDESMRYGEAPAIPKLTDKCEPVAHRADGADIHEAVRINLLLRLHEGHAAPPRSSD